MSLRSKMLVLLFVATSGCLLLAYGVLSAFLFPSFGNLQARITENDVARVDQALRSVYDDLEASNRDLAEWNATYAFVQRYDESYLRDNINEIFFRDLDLNLALFFNVRGELVWGAAYDHGIDAYVPLDSVLEAPIAPDDPLLVHPNEMSEHHGVLCAKRGPLAVDSHPILTTNSDGPVMGSLILGRFLGADRLQEMQQQTRVAFTLKSFSDMEASPLDHAAATLLRNGGEAHLRKEQDDAVLTHLLLRDVYGEPAYVIEVRTQRDVAALGMNALQASLIFLLLTALCFMAVIWIGLQRITIGPIAMLESHIHSIRESGDLSQRIALQRGDEIGSLSDQFDAMTIELEQARHEMTEARDRAIDLARMKSEFLATMSHEIRTPMNGVIGLSEVLLDTRLDDDQRRFMESIRKSADGLLAIINDILDFSKLDAGKVELELRDFGLRGLLEDLALMFASSAQAKGIELALRIPCDLDIVCRGDPTRLRQVLSNLVGNAIKFTHEGEVVIGVSMLDRGGDSAEIRFEVRDTGIGVPLAQQAKIFESFSQADASTTRKFGGTGLGLTICKSLVTLMGGDLRVESDVGLGSSFFFAVRFTGVRDIREPEAESVEGLRGKRVLIVDDNATNREILRDEMAAWSMSAICAADGPQALEQLRTAHERGESFDVALLDQHMPGMHGSALAKRIRQSAPSAALPLVLLSSLQTQKEPEERARDGIAAHLLKPVRQVELRSCLLRLIQGGVQDALPGAAPEPLSFAARVLVAEDNAVNQQVAIAMLRSLGCTAEVAVDGREAVEATIRSDYDLVLMDCEMPVMDGYQAAAEIRRREISRGVARRLPIVALTAHVLEDERERCSAAGMNDYLGKPFKRDELAKLIARWTGESADRVPGALAEGGAGPAPAAEEPLDRDTLEALRALQRPGGPDVLANVVAAYLDSATALVEELRAASSQLDGEAMRRAAHILKSSSRNVGARGLGELSERLETLCREADVAGAKELVDAIERENERVERALEAELDV